MSWRMSRHVNWRLSWAVNWRLFDKGKNNNREKGTDMAASLVAYFSASGVTKGVAQRLARATGSDLFEIVPAEPYTAADLDWRDARSRSTLESKDPAARPALAAEPGDLSGYDTVYVGFPIWWYTAPAIVKTFLEAAGLSGARVALFATSGGSGMGSTQADLEPCAPRVEWVGSRRFSAGASEAELAAWAQGL